MIFRDIRELYRLKLKKIDEKNLSITTLTGMILILLSASLHAENKLQRSISPVKENKLRHHFICGDYVTGKIFEVRKNGKMIPIMIN